MGQRIVPLPQFIMMWLHPYLIVRKHREKTEKGVQLIYAIDSGKNPPLAQNRSFSKHSRFSFLDAFRRIDVALRWPQGICPAVQHTFQKSFTAIITPIIISPNTSIIHLKQKYCYILWNSSANTFSSSTSNNSRNLAFVSTEYFFFSESE